MHRDSHLRSIRSLIDYEPDVIAPGHGRQQMFADILPVGETDFGMDPSWVSIYPYQNQILLSAGERQRIEIRVRYYRPEPMKIEATLAARWGLRVQPEVVKFEIPGRSDAARPVPISGPARGPLQCRDSRSRAT